MTLTLLLDLDDTLLGNDMSTFLPGYLKSMAEHMGAYSAEEPLVKALLTSTSEMLGNESPELTLKETLDAKFYPQLGWDYDAMQAPLQDFYANVFPSLKSLAEFRPQAVELVKQAFHRGYQVAVATNPLFPRTAILQRLEWAGLPVDEFDFGVISSYENFHFAKPNPAYYGEILAYLGWPEGPVVMVGDSADSDIFAAQRLGLATFWITENGDINQVSSSPRSGTGRLEDVLAWIDSIPLEELEPKFNQPNALIAILQSTPAAINTLTKNISEKIWKKRPTEDEWNLTELVCHLRDTESEVNLTRLKKIMEEENPFVAGVDTDVWVEERNYHSQNGLKALSDFTATRIDTINLLLGLSEQDWQRTARHTIFGPTMLQELTNIIARHDRIHIQQILELLSVIQGQRI
ncbi:MAG: HAD hydrolase-like protein [Chloroflexi bacterium]|nr:HAD hydrolase-like protein [Chloroflexota bacterium]